MLITVWETALPGFAVPDAIAYVQVIICIFYFIGINGINLLLHELQAIGFIVERFQTACNVCSDMFIIRMIQAGIDRERKQQQLSTTGGAY
jgi:hypothetical protein